jgi:hypothetical protein
MKVVLPKKQSTKYRVFVNLHVWGGVFEDLFTQVL